MDATVESLVAEVFDHELPSDGEASWFSAGGLHFAIEPRRQLALLAALFTRARSLLSGYSAATIEQGLWCMMGAEHCESFTGLVWNAALPFAERSAVIRSVYELYDQVLARYPFEAIDFRHPDAEPRRFQTIDYMAPDLLLSSPWFPAVDPQDEARISEIFFDLFRQLVGHAAPVAQYAGLHGLGHLTHPDRSVVIDRYLAQQGWLAPGQREYALAAREGDLL